MLVTANCPCACYKYTSGEQSVFAVILYLGTRQRQWASFTPGNSPPHTHVMSRRLHGLQNWSENFREKPLSCITGNLTTIPLSSSPQFNQYTELDIPAFYTCTTRKTDVTTSFFPSTNVMVECVAFLIRGHEFPGLIPQFRVRISYGFAWSISVPPDNSRNSSYPNYTTKASFHILSITLFTTIQIKSSDSIVLQWLRYRSGDRGIEVRFPSVQGTFSVLQKRTDRLWFRSTFQSLE